MFRFFINHLQGVSGTSKHQRYRSNGMLVLTVYCIYIVSLTPCIFYKILIITPTNAQLVLLYAVRLHYKIVYKMFYIF
jgi:hypothetical protein